MKIAVYCASVFGNNEEYVKAARELGQWIGKNNHALVYGGGETGLMGALCARSTAGGGSGHRNARLHRAGSGPQDPRDRQKLCDPVPDRI